MTKAEEVEVVRKSRDVKNIPQRRLLIALGVVLVLSIISLGFNGLFSYITLRGTAEDGTALAQQIKQQCDQPTITSPDLMPFCPRAEAVVQDAPGEVKAAPVAAPQPAEDGDDGLQGEAGPPPTDAQVLTAVRSFCTSTRLCRAKDGADATPAQVAIAVASYCDNRGECRAPAADSIVPNDGVDGSDGKDAPPVTQAQLISAVESFCSQTDQCQNGEDGADSTVPGPPGIVKVVDNCGPTPEGQALTDVNPSYDSESQTVSISCVYTDTGLIPTPQNGSE